MVEQDRVGILVERFAREVSAQSDALASGDPCNDHATRYVAAFHELRALGDAGRDALAPLLDHPRPDVRVAAAGFLLRHRTEHALRVLRAASAGEGRIPFVASQAIARWEDGTWNLDPPE